MSTSSCNMFSIRHFNLYPEHFIQRIMDELPFCIALALACNGSSPFQIYLLNSIYKEIEIQYASPLSGLKLQFLKQFYLLSSNVTDPNDEVISSPFKVLGKNIESLENFIVENPRVTIRNLRLVAKPSQEIFAKVRSLVNRIRKITFISDYGMDGQQDSIRTLPTESDPAFLYGLRIRFVERMYFPESLVHLDLSFSHQSNYGDSLSGILFKLQYPPRLKYLRLSSSTEVVDPKVFSRFPRSIKSLVLHFHNIESDGYVILDLPPLLHSFSCTTIADERNRCFDISHLAQLTEVKLFFYYHSIPLSIFKFPRSMQTLTMDSGLSSTGMEQLAELDQLKQVAIRIYRSPNRPVPTSREAVYLPNSIKDLSIQDNTIEGNIDGAYFVPKSTKKLQLYNSDGLNFLLELKFLQSLHISYSSFTMPHLQNLNTLVIKNSKIDSTSMWKDVAHLSNLRHLSINDCGLDGLNCTLPDSLQTLNVARNNIHEVDIILPLNFKNLDVSHNEICKLNAKGGLLRLNLNNNCMSKLSYSTLSIPSTVCELNLSNNYEMAISSEFFFPESAKILHLKNNHFSDCMALSKMPSQILLLSLDSCCFKHLENKEPIPIIMNYPKLWQFSMESATGIEHFEFNWNSCPNLENILMHNSKIEVVNLANLPPSVKIVDFTNCQIQNVKGIFEGLPDLVEFNLEANQLAPWTEVLKKQGMGHLSKAVRW